MLKHLDGQELRSVGTNKDMRCISFSSQNLSPLRSQIKAQDASNLQPLEAKNKKCHAEEAGSEVLQAPRRGGSAGVRAGAENESNGGKNGSSSNISPHFSRIASRSASHKAKRAPEKSLPRLALSWWRRRACGVKTLRKPPAPSFKHKSTSL